ncbi:MAG: GNAT family N-acetyltransferase [Angelakisella sp.]
MTITVSNLSKKYSVAPITEEKMSAVYELCQGNPTYYRYMKIDVTPEGVAGIAKALPPNKSYEDKFFLGFYQQERLVAIMDLILDFPVPQTAFIGLFMMNKACQGQGIGSEIMGDVLASLAEQGFTTARLGYIKGNAEAQGFWCKNSFVPTGAENETEAYTIVVMEKALA